MTQDDQTAPTGPDGPARTTGLMRGPAIFADPGHHRRIVVRLVMAFGGLFVAGWVAWFGLSLYFVGKLPSVIPPAAETVEEGRLFDDFAPAAGALPDAAAAPGMCAGPPPSTARPRPPLFGYVQTAPDNGVERLAPRCNLLAAILTEWFAYAPAAGEVRLLVADPTAEAHLRMAADGRPIIPVVQVSLAPQDGLVLADPAAQARAVRVLADFAGQDGVGGLCLRPSDLAPGDIAAFRGFAASLALALREAGRQSCLVSEAEDGLWGDPELVRPFDRVVLLAFRRPAAGGQPAPLAPQGWFEGVLDAAVAAVGAERLIVALGNHGRVWTAGAPLPNEISYAEAMLLASRHAGRAEFPAAALNTAIRFTDDAGRLHRIWLLDAVSLANQMAALARHPVAGIALWSSGLEDPGSWEVLAAGGGLPATRLQAVTLDDWLAYSGEGAFLRVAGPARPGERLLTVDPQSGLIVGQRYVTLPSPQGVERYGRPAPGEVVLTFDDGPDPAQTAALLDILKAHGATATFFTVGRNLMANPDLARRIVAEGHEIGSHSFLHPETEAISAMRLKMELNATQRLLIALTRRGTILFRTPYGRSEGPVDTGSLAPLGVLDDEGYLSVGADIVPRDWEALTPEAIVAEVMAGLDGVGGKVVVLHDAGGDRSATLAAIDRLIPALIGQGYRIVSLGHVLDLPPDAVMPWVGGTLVRFDQWSFAFLGALGGWIGWLFWIIVIAGGLRGLAVLGAALLSRPVVRATTDGPPPPVTVLVPAFNEAGVIVDCLRSVMASDHPDLRVIVIDDGSRDATLAAVTEAFATDPRVRLLREPNQGKWAALNLAYGAVETPFVVAVDADTRLAPDAVRRILAPFADQGVGAVAGMVRVGNRRGLLPRLQTLEYMTAQNIDRRAAELVNAMMVVPGAIGAWRVAAVREAGLYSAATLTEDADLTVSVLRAGYRVEFVEEAEAVTEVPVTVRAFLAQRLRWTLGMMQTAWKHRGAIGEGRAVGLIAIPDLALFGVGLGLLAPLADLVFLAVLADMAVNLWAGRPAVSEPATVTMLAGYLALPLLDVLTVMVALRFDRKERAWLLLLIPLQRLVARPLFALTVWRSVARALSGTLAAWGTQVRRGLSPLPPARDGS